MRFEPNIVSPESAPMRHDGELDLPDDLAMLAEQLADDSLRLQQCYGPGSSEMAELVACSERIASRNRRLWLSVAGAACVALGCAVIVPWLVGIDSSERSTAAATADPLEFTSTPVEVAVPAISLRERERFVSLDESQPPPLQLLGKVSGPEREGVLDLLEAETAAVPSISF